MSPIKSDLLLSNDEILQLDLNYLSWLPQSRDAAILDVECGSGRILVYLHSLGFNKVKGLDREASSLPDISEMSGLTVEVQEVSADYFRSNPDTLDVIIMKQMIYYLPRNEVLDFMSAIAVALKPEGRVIVEFFNGALVSSRRTELKDPFILTAYTEHSMKRLMEAAGFRVVSVAGEKRNYLTLKSKLYCFLRATWMKLLNAIYILERGSDNELPSIFTKSLIVVGEPVEEKPVAHIASVG